LFRLQTADQVSERLTFYNPGPFQIPGLIVMSLSDIGEENLDPNYGLIVVLFNANNAEQQFTEELFTNLPLTLHPVQMTSTDGVVQTAIYDPTTATFTVPGRTTAVFILAEADATITELLPPATPLPTPEPTAEPTATAEPTSAATAEPTVEPTEGVAEATAVATEPAPSETADAANDTSALPWILGGGLVLALGAVYWLSRRRY
jgi:hypothetical protein